MMDTEAFAQLQNRIMLIQESSAIVQRGEWVTLAVGDANAAELLRRYQYIEDQAREDSALRGSGHFMQARSLAKKLRASMREAGK